MIFDRRRYWLPLLLVTFLTGCSGKGDGDAKKADDAKIMDREERPPKRRTARQGRMGPEAGRRETAGKGGNRKGHRQGDRRGGSRRR